MTSPKHNYWETADPPSNPPWDVVGTIVLEAFDELITALAADGRTVRTHHLFSQGDEAPFWWTGHLSSGPFGTVVTPTVIFQRPGRDERLTFSCDIDLGVSAVIADVLDDRLQPEGDLDVWAKRQAMAAADFIISRRALFHHLLDVSLEWAHAEEGPRRDETHDPARRLVEFQLRAAETATKALSRLRTTLGRLMVVPDSILGSGDPERLPEWPRRWLNELDGLSAWLPRLASSARLWKWWQAEETGDHSVQLVLEFDRWPAEWAELNWLLDVSGLTVVDKPQPLDG